MGIYTNQIFSTNIVQALNNASVPTALNPFVTLSQISTITTITSGVLLGRYSVGSGLAQEITIGSGLSLSGLGVLSATGGGGTVSSVSVTTANGVSAVVATSTTTPALTFTLGIITPTSVNGITFSGSGSITNTGVSSLSAFTGSGTSSGTNTGDQTITLTGNVTGSGTGSFATTIAVGVVTNTMIANTTIDLTTKVTGILPIANGGTNASSQVTNGVNYFDGTRIKSLATFLFDGTNLGIGVTPQSLLTVSKQTTIQAPVAGTSIHFVGLDGNPCRETFDTHSSTTAGSVILFRKSYGTSTTPLAIGAANVTIGGINAIGYGTTGYGAASTGLAAFKSNQIFTDVNMGTYYTVYTTPDNSVTAAEALRVTGAGAINAIQSGGVYQINSVTVLSATTLGSAITNSSLTSLGTLTSLTTNSITLSGNISSAAWTTNGVRIIGVSATFTDTTSSGTVAAGYTNAFGSSTIAASSATTFTDYFNAYHKDPIAGTNVTLTNKWGLGSDSVKFGTSNAFSVTTTGITNIGAATATGRILDIKQDTSTTSIGSRIGTTSNGALYFNQTTPSSSNYALAGTTTITELNATTTLALNIGDIQKMIFTGNTFIHNISTTSSGSATQFLWNAAAATGVTAATEKILFDFASNITLQHASNTAVATQRAIVFRAPTYSFASATGTITNAATVAITAAPVVGTNAAITNSYALWVQGGVSRFDGNISGGASIIMAGATSVIRLKSYTVAGLPAGTQGDTAYVTDALAPTFLATIVGGGAVVAPVFYNGTNWVGY